MQLTGFHHLTAVTAAAARNRAFYTDTLGMRLVKKTVNQDDTSAYHLFYADGKGSPGTDITFFDWPSPRERRGTHSIARTGLRVAGPESLKYWADRLTSLGVTHAGVADRNGRPTLEFEDFEGQRLSLVADSGPWTPNPWAKSPVPAEHQVRGLGPITLSVPDVRPTEAILTQVMSMRKTGQYAARPTDGSEGESTVHVYQSGLEGPAGELHVAEEPKLPFARAGAGGVHHVAFRVPTYADYDAWQKRLGEFGVPNSGAVDRFYFRSLYFREPNGILFELATDEPGFHADEPMETLGERLSLPPFLENRRAQIEAHLKPL
ncbi:MAG TPA: ring-cleaving dioxygenase [Humisphaera sp.]